MASAVHLTLPEVMQYEWLLADAAYWIGALLLAITGCLAGWLLCAVGLAIPLLFLSDQLTQSVYLLACALAALASFVGLAEGRSDRLGTGLPGAVRVLTVGVYAAAALHKINGGFLNPEISCANGGVRVLADNWAIDALLDPGLTSLWPPLFLAAEVTVVVLLVARPGAALVVALAMHIPLTIVFAPSFAFTMMSGWVCLLTEDELAHLGRTLRARAVPIGVVGFGLGALSFALYMQRHWVVYAFWSFKEALLWVALVWMLFAWWRRPAGVFGWLSAWRERLPRASRAVAITAALLWTGNALLPYTGVTFHHSGAMLSNLRIDDACWNSALFPRDVRAVDPFLRLDDVHVGGDVPGRSALEATLESRLFTLRTLELERRELCVHGAGPIIVRATHADRVVEDLDLCAREWPLGRPALPGVQRYQTNLLRTCDQACIH